MVGAMEKSKKSSDKPAAPTWGFRGMTSAAASEKKLSGHAAEQEFAYAIGGEVIHGRGKADVRDGNGATYSVKGNSLKWQIFLYGHDRLTSTHTPWAEALAACTSVFPLKRAEYLSDKQRFKNELQPKMRKLCAVLGDHATLSGFLDWALFEGHCENLVIHSHGEIVPIGFHIFPAAMVISTLTSQVTVVNSRARATHHYDDQKVVFAVMGSAAVGEIEMRNDSEAHYREVKFWLSKQGLTTLLTAHATSTESLPNGVYVYSA
jgi:hypothetical protein